MFAYLSVQTSYLIDNYPSTQLYLIDLLSCCFSGRFCDHELIILACTFMSSFDEFVLIRQAILLTIDTFGFSHILPVFGLPFLLLTAGDEPKRFPFARLSVVSPYCAWSFALLHPMFS